MRKIILMMILATILLSGCQNENREIKSLDDLKNARIGSWPECGYELKAREVLPNAKFVHLDFLSEADLIRARTYDAFIPIITIALVYLLLSKVLFLITDVISRKIDPKNRKKAEILPGVKL